MSPTIPKFLVVHLDDQDCVPNEVRKEPLPPISVQILDSHGCVCEKVGYIDLADTSLVIEGEIVPEVVIRASKRLTPGESVYLNEDGNPVHPF